MSWPTRKITFETYPDWYALMVDATVDEVDRFSKAVAANQMDVMLEIVFELIQEWNITDRKGDDLPLALDSMRHLPTMIMRDLVEGIAAVINQTAIPK